MLRVGLTGGIGCGKSVVAEMFRELGSHIIDADEIAHRLVTPGSPVLAAISKQFGQHFLNSDGSLDRKKLGQHVFASPAQRKILEALIHPAVRDDIRQQLESCQHEAYVIIAIPLLLETGYTELIDRVLVVDCEETQQIQRAAQRDARDREQIESIMQQQISRAERLRRADDVLENNTDLATLQLQVAELHQKYLCMPAR
jgi:dephospho-CoA kinase